MLTQRFLEQIAGLFGDEVISASDSEKDELKKAGVGGSEGPVAEQYESRHGISADTVKGA